MYKKYIKQYDLLFYSRMAMNTAIKQFLRNTFIGMD